MEATRSDSGLRAAGGGPLDKARIDPQGSPPAAPESYVLSLVAEGKVRAAFEAIRGFGSPHLYAPAFTSLGQRLWRTGKAAEAIAALECAVELDAELASAWLALGMVRLSEGDTKEGDRCLAQAISLYGEQDSDRSRAAAPGHYLRGVVALSFGRGREAVGHFTSCLELDPGYRNAAAELRRLSGALAVEDSMRARAEDALARAARSESEEPRRATLSACLITKDEAEALPQCLRSLRPVADQIVVVDTGSSDGTVEIARAFGAEVHDLPWQNDFSAARNAAIGYATGDWILIVDADEELPATSATQLEELLGHPIPGPVCQLLTHAPTQNPSRYGIDLVGHLRLFRNGEGLHFEGAIHEQLFDRQGRLVDAAVATGILVAHHGYLESPGAMAERSERNLSMITSQCEADPGNPYLLFHLGHAYLGCGRIEEAVEALRQAVELGQPSHAFCTKAAVLLAHALSLLARPAEAESVAREALSTQPQHPELLCALGQALEDQGRVEEGIGVYREAARGRFGPSTDYHDFACRDVVPRGRLAAICMSRGDAEGAVEELAAALVVRPEAIELRHMLASAFVQLGEHGRARAELDAALEENPEDVVARNVMGVAFAMESRHAEAARHFELAVALRPEDVDLWCNLGEARHALGELEAACDCFEGALKRQPNHAGAWLGLGKAYLARGSYPSSVKCYQMAAQASGYAPEVLAEVAAARETLASLAREGREGGSG